MTAPWWWERHRGYISLDVQAFLWSRNKGMRNLNNLVDMPERMWLSSAQGINNSNQIIAAAFNFNDQTSKGLAYLLTPVTIE